MSDEPVFAMDESGYVVGASEPVSSDPVSIEEKSVSEFKLGDVVRMKSGSPMMTIVHVHPDNPLLRCGCYDNGTWHDCDLPPEALTLIETSCCGGPCCDTEAPPTEATAEADKPMGYVTAEGEMVYG